MMVAKRPKNIVSYVSPKLSRQEAQDMFEMEMFLMGIEFRQSILGINVYNIDDNLSKEVLKQLNNKWYVRDITVRSINIMKWRAKVHTKFTQLEFMGPRL